MAQERTIQIAGTGTFMGIGLGLRPKYFSHILQTTAATRLRDTPSIDPPAPDVMPDWFEVITENFMCSGGKPRRILETIRRDYPIVTHGVGLSIGSDEDVQAEYLKHLKSYIQWLQPAFITDHLCWTRLGSTNSHDLLPLSYNRKSLQKVVYKVLQVQDYLQRAIALENPSVYVQMQDSDMGEVDFLNELVAQTGCGILLDLNNLYVNSVNLGLNEWDYLHRLDPQAVWQFHLAGHSQNSSALIDTHDHPVPPQVWELYQVACRKWPDASPCVEWDDRLPSWDKLMAECILAHTQRSKDCSTDFNQIRPDIPAQALMQPDQIAAAPLKNVQQRFLTSLLTPATGNKTIEVFLKGELPLPAEQGMAIYQHAYFARAYECLTDTFPALLYICGEEGFSNLVSAFLESQQFAHFSLKYIAAPFPEFIATKPISYDFGVTFHVLAELADFEWQIAEFFDRFVPEEVLPFTRLSELSAQDWESVCFQFRSNFIIRTYQTPVLDLYHSYQEQYVPDKPNEVTPAEPFHVLIWRAEEAVEWRQLTGDEYFSFQCLQQHSFQEAVIQVSIHQNISEVEALNRLMQWLLCCNEYHMISASNY